LIGDSNPNWVQSKTGAGIYFPCAGFCCPANKRILRANSESLFSYGEGAAMGRGIPLMLSIADKRANNAEGTEVLLVWKNLAPEND